MPLQQQSPIRLRLYALTFGAILALQGAWILAAEIIRYPLPYFPMGQAEITAATEHQTAAFSAAQIGYLRGDLWTDYALAADAGLLNDIGKPDTDSRKREIAQRAARLAPYDSRIWLLLSAMNAQPGWTDARTAAQLKMSFYTSPNDIRLIPLRLRIAARSDLSADDELQYVIEHQVRTIALQKPALKSAIAIAYREASPVGRQLINKTVAEIDPALSGELGATKP